MTIKTIAITIAALLLTVSSSEARRYDLSREFCGDKYCGYYEQKRVSKKVRKSYRTVIYKEKTKVVPLPHVKPKSLIGEAQTEFDGAKFIKKIDLVARAKKYLGTNPTGWASLWCGRFMCMIAPEACKKIGNGNLAINWTKLPKTTPRVGAILVTRRNGGNHVGIVIGFNRMGNPITISGNHGRKVGIGTYPKYKIIAYVTA